MRYLPALDGLRGVAIILVLFEHVDSGLFPAAGGTGVTVFFVLSGYLITSLLTAEHSSSGRIDFLAFYARRALRLLPALVVLVALTPLVMLLVGDPRLRSQWWDSAGPALFYYRDFTGALGHSGGVFNHTWSLSVEEQFYFVWPLLVMAFAGPRLRRWVFGLTAAAILWRVVAPVFLSRDWVYYAPDTNAFSLLLGASLSQLDLSRYRIKPWLPLGAIILLSVASGGLYGRTDFKAFDSLGAALVGGVLIVAAQSNPAVLTWPALRWLGQISYGLYLWHNTLFSIRFHGLGLRVPGKLVLVPVSIGIAAASFYLLERPILRHRRRFQRAPAIIKT